MNVKDSTQLNYHVLCANTLHEVHEPLHRPRITRVHQSHTIHRHSKSYTLETRASHKDYKMVYTKRALELGKDRRYPFGYQHSEKDGYVMTIDDDVDQSD